MYNFNEELCRQLSNGEIAVHYNNGNLEMLSALLKKCAPKDDNNPMGTDDFYAVDKNGFWYSFETTKPAVPLSDFIVKEEFVWTDELVKEFALQTKINGTSDWVFTQLEQFKASKQRKPLFTTEDGKQIFEEGAEVVCVEKDFNIRKAYLSMFATQIQCNKYFSTEAAAIEYVRLNKPMYSLKQIEQAFMVCEAVSGNLKKLIAELESLKQ